MARIIAEFLAESLCDGISTTSCFFQFASVDIWNDSENDSDDDDDDDKTKSTKKVFPLRFVLRKWASSFNITLDFGGEDMTSFLFPGQHCVCPS